jgi:hypothetical protein
MRIRYALAVLAATFMAAGAAIGPADAATSGNTTTTFTVSVTGTGLAITVPGTASLGTGTPGSTITAQLGTVQVTDSRAVDPAAWTASVTSTDFTIGGTADTIPVADVAYWSGPTTATVGSGTFTPGQPTSADRVPLSAVTPLTAMSLAGGAGSNSASWDPTLVVSVPAAAVAGLYEGTVTHSVA